MNQDTEHKPGLLDSSEKHLLLAFIVCVLAGTTSYLMGWGAIFSVIVGVIAFSITGACVTAD